MIDRIQYLGSEVKAQAFFLDKERNPISSKNPSMYPLFRVIDPAQDIVTTGIGTLNQDTLAYEAIFTIPQMAMLSQDNSPYHIEWELIDTGDRSWFYTESFEVVHPDYDITAAKEQQKLTLPFTSLSLSLPLPQRIQNVSLEIYSQSAQIPIFRAIPTQVGLYNEYYIYGCTVPPNILKANTDYLAVWCITDKGQVYSYIQVIHCVSLWEMQRISDLRMYLDKVAKDVDLYTGYKDSDLYFYLVQGADYINSVKTPTNWTLTSWQQLYALKDSYYWLLEAAKWCALRAQYLAEGDSSFDFSGQPVSLSVDRTGFIESELGRIKDGLDNQMSEWKNQVVKNMRVVGHLNLTFPTVPTRYGIFDFRQLGIPLQMYPTFRG